MQREIRRLQVNDVSKTQDLRARVDSNSPLSVGA
jgi:hypothetical protein